jgi:hypothetical protein
MPPQADLTIIEITNNDPKILCAFDSYEITDFHSKPPRSKRICHALAKHTSSQLPTAGAWLEKLVVHQHARRKPIAHEENICSPVSPSLVLRVSSSLAAALAGTLAGLVLMLTCSPVVPSRKRNQVSSVSLHRAYRIPFGAP